MNFEYIYPTDVLADPFYKLPKILFIHENFKKLSTECKVLYSFLLDRTSLSINNNWHDSENRVYVCFTVEEATDLLGKSRSTVLRTFSTLDCGSGVGLIQRKKRGQGKADLIYVKKIVCSQEELQKNQSSLR